MNSRSYRKRYRPCGIFLEGWPIRSRSHFLMAHRTTPRRGKYLRGRFLRRRADL